MILIRLSFNCRMFHCFALSVHYSRALEWFRRNKEVWHPCSDTVLCVWELQVELEVRTWLIWYREFIAINQNSWRLRAKFEMYETSPVHHHLVIESLGRSWCELLRNVEVYLEDYLMLRNRILTLIFLSIYDVS